MSHVVHLVFKDKPSLPLQPVVVSETHSKVWLNHHITNAHSHFLFHFTHEEPFTTFDVSGIEKYVLLFFQKEASGIQFKEAVFYYAASKSPTLVETSYKLALVLPLTALQSVEGLQSLHVKYSNDTLSWPTAIAGKYAFKIPEKSRHLYANNALAPLAIQQVSEEAFYAPSKELPLFVKVPQKMIPDDAYLYELAKETVVRYAVIHKSYLSGFLFGIHIYEMSPNHLVPNLIYKENEIHI